MAPKRKASATKAEPAKKAAKAEPKAKAKAEPKAAAKSKAKAAAPAPAPAKRGSKKEVTPEDFTAKLLEVCKVLMTVCETVVAEDPKELTVVSENNFKTNGGELLMLLPEDARLQMMQIAMMYQEELDADPPFLWDELDEEDEEDNADAEEEDDDEEDDDDDDFMRPEHFFIFKKYFTQAEASKFMEKADGAMEAALNKMMDGLDEEEEEDDEEPEDDEEDDDTDWTDASVPWKGEKKGKGKK